MVHVYFFIILSIYSNSSVYNIKMETRSPTSNFKLRLGSYNLSQNKTTLNIKSVSLRANTAIAAYLILFTIVSVNLMF